MDKTTSFQRLGSHYYTSINRNVKKLVIAVLVILAVFALITAYQSWLNQHYQTKVQKMLEVKKVISENTHVKSFHTEIVYQ